MRRREFGSLAGGIAASTVWSSRLSAQQKAMPVIGFMSGRSPQDSAHLVAAFRLACLIHHYSLVCRARNIFARGRESSFRLLHRDFSILRFVGLRFQ